jgi:hypothetical protein
MSDHLACGDFYSMGQHFSRRLKSRLVHKVTFFMRSEQRFNGLPQPLITITRYCEIGRSLTRRQRDGSVKDSFQIVPIMVGHAA